MDILTHHKCDARDMPTLGEMLKTTLMLRQVMEVNLQGQNYQKYKST